MAREVSIGAQGFEDVRMGGFFYVDKTGFLRDWWRAGDTATLVCRPRRFGKTLLLDTVRCFLSLEFARRGQELFGDLAVWVDAAMRELQGTVPVVALSFADCKRTALDEALADMKRMPCAAVRRHTYLLDSPAVDGVDRAFLARVSDGMDDATATTCLQRLCSMLHRHHGVKPVVLLDEYDTPMQEAWLSGYWDGMSAFMRSLMNSTFKTNPDMGRALMTGITCVAQESIFSDLNNLQVVTVTTRKYQTAFGFTQAEVDEARRRDGDLPRPGSGFRYRVVIAADGRIREACSEPRAGQPDASADQSRDARGFRPHGREVVLTGGQPVQRLHPRTAGRRRGRYDRLPLRSGSGLHVKLRLGHASGARPSRALLAWAGAGASGGTSGPLHSGVQPREGFGRYDVALVPVADPGSPGGTDPTGLADPAVILEFKVFDARKGEASLKDTVASACAQIEKRAYAASLVERGIDPVRIRAYGIAFHGKEVLVGQS